MTKHSQYFQTVYDEISHVHMSSTQNIQTIDCRCTTTTHPLLMYVSYIHLRHLTCMMRNSVGHIIMYPTTFFNPLDGSVIQFYIFIKHILIVVADLHLQRHTTFTHDKSMQCTPSTFMTFPRAIIVSSLPSPCPITSTTSLAKNMEGSGSSSSSPSSMIVQ